MYAPPQIIETEVFARLPDKFRHKDPDNAWAIVNRRGVPVDSFLEGPSFDRDGQLTLVERLSAADAARHDLARLGDVAFENGKIFVVDGLHAFGGEAAKFLAAGKTAHGHRFVLTNSWG